MAEGEKNGEQAERISREAAVESARRLTGRSPHIVAGALAGDSRSSFTEAQLKKVVDDFAKRPEAGSS